MGKITKAALIILLLFFALIFCGGNARAEEHSQQPQLLIGVSEMKPMVMKTDIGFRGFDVDLMKAIAEDQGWGVWFGEYEFSDLFKAVSQGKIDLAISGITINADRERLVDFSHPYFDSGLSIAVLEKHETSGLMRKSLFTWEVMRWFFILLVFAFLSGILYLSVEKKHLLDENGGIFSGVFTAFYYAITTSATVGYGDIAPKTLKGKWVAIFIMLTGIMLFSMFTAQLSSAMTANRIEYDIASASDLRGKKVATIKDTTAVSALSDLQAQPILENDLNSAFLLLEQKKIDAVVFDAPAILYYGKTEGSGVVTTTGEMFDKQYYGIAMKQNSPLRERINRSILKLKANGVYDRIYKKWFGNV